MIVRYAYVSGYVDPPAYIKDTLRPSGILHDWKVLLDKKIKIIKTNKPNLLSYECIDSRWIKEKYGVIIFPWIITGNKDNGVINDKLRSFIPIDNTKGNII